MRGAIFSVFFYDDIDKAGRKTLRAFLMFHFEALPCF